MKNKTLIGSLVIPALLLGSLFIAHSIARFDKVKIVVSGTAGLPFTGSCTGTDSTGKTLAQNLSGVVPQEFVVDARTLNFTLQQKQGAGSLDVAVYRSGSQVRTVSSGGVRGKVGRMEISAQAF